MRAAVMEALEPRVMLSIAPLTGTPFGTSGSYGNSGNTYAKAMDGDLNTYFDAPSANGDYFGLDLGTAQTVGSVRFAPRQNFAGRMVGGKIQGSNTSATSGYADLYTISSAPPVGSITIANITNTTAYRWVRYLAPNGGYGNVSEMEFEAPATTDVLPTGWSEGEVGTPHLPGSADYDSATDTWTVTGGGWDIFDDGAEQYHFVHTDLVGDGTVSAQVTSVQNTSNWAKGGLALRDGTATGAAYAAVVVTPGAGAMFGWRNTANGSVTWVTVAGVAPPQYLKLGRVGQSVSAYYSANGTSWTQIGTTQSIALGATAQAGLAVAAHTNSQDNTSTFTAVGLTVAATVPDAPGNLTAQAGDGQVALAWDAADGADTYNIYRGAATGGEGVTPIQTGVTVTSYTDSTVTNGTEYFYKVSAVNEVGESARSNEDSATPQAIAFIISGNGTVDEGAVYTLSMSSSFPSGMFSSKTINWGDDTTDTVNAAATSATHVFPNGPYAFPVQVSVEANGVSHDSNVVEVTIRMFSPEVTASGNASVVSGSAYTLNLSAVYPSGDADNDQIRQWVIDWGDGSDWQMADGTTSSVSHTFAPGVATPVVYATATDDDLTYAADPLTVNVTGVTAPQSPANLTATAYSSTQIDLSWSDPNGDATGFTIERSNDAGQNWQTVATVAGEQTTYSDTGLNPATNYSYRVTSANDAGSSNSSSPTNNSTSGSAPSLSADTSGSQMILTWGQGGAGVTGYELEMKQLDSDENYHLIATPSAADSSYSPSLMADKSYSFRIRADYADGTVSDYSTKSVGAIPAAPTDVQVTPKSRDSVEVSWRDNSLTEQGFKVEKSTDGGLSWTDAGSASSKAPERCKTTVSGLQMSSSYAFRVSAYNDKGSSGFAAASFGTPSKTGSPPQPDSDMVYVDEGVGYLQNIEVFLHLDGGNYDGIEYEITLDGDTRSGAMLNDGFDPSNPRVYELFDGVSLSSGSLMSAQVRTYNAEGESGWVTAVSPDEPGDYDPPEVPDYQVDAPSSSSIQLTWSSPPEGGDGGHYEVQFAAEGTGFSSEMEYGPTDSGPMTFSGLQPDTTYLVRVRAGDYFGFSKQSSVQTITTPPANPTAAPTAPSHVWQHVETGSYPNDKPSENKVILSWSNDPNNEEGYRIERSDDGGTTWRQISSTGTDETTYTDDQNLLPGDYTYRITAFNSAGEANITASAGVWPPGHLVAFDGTWDYIGRGDDFPEKNDAWGGTSVIGEFANQYRQTGTYERGIGTGTDADPAMGLEHAVNGAFAVDAGKRIGDAYDRTMQFYQDEDHRKKIPLDIIGYSRGSFQAMKFVTMLADSGLTNLSDRGTSSAIKVRFMGLISPVGQFGADPLLHLLTLGAFEFNFGWPTDVPINVLHYVEARDNNPGDLTFPENHMNFGGSTDGDHQTFNGDHGQVGHAGGVGKQVLEYFVNSARNVNVPVAKLSNTFPS